MTYPDRRPSPAAHPITIATRDSISERPTRTASGAPHRPRGRDRWPAGLGRVDRRRRRRGDLHRGISRFPRHPASARGGRRAVRPRRRRERSGRRRAGRARRRGPRGSYVRARGRPGVTGALGSIVTMPVLRHPRHARGDAEAGSFITARLARVRVLEFGIGFPPRAKDRESKGETLYTLNWLPIGGFVKLEGEDGDRSGDPRAFSAQSLPVRLLILVSGVVMNVVLAFAMLPASCGSRHRRRASASRSSPVRRPPDRLAPVRDRRHRRSALPADGRPRHPRGLRASTPATRSSSPSTAPTGPGATSP